jgi:hypothetical protein
VKRLPAICLAVLLLGALAAAPSGARAAEPFAGGCPKEALEEGSVGKLNHNPRARKAILPAGATSMRLCRYYGFGAGNQTPKTQARAGELQDQAEVHGRDLLETLTLEFKELEAAPKGPISCPFDEGAELYAVFSYPHGQPVILDIGLSGCRFVGNGYARARWLGSSLETRLIRLVEGKRVKPGPKHDEVKEKGAAYRPPLLSHEKAENSAKGLLKMFCEESKLCQTQEIGLCTRRNAKAFGCRYTAELLSGEVCRGTISIKALGGGPILESPGLQAESEGECFYLFAPPGFKEEEEEREKEKAQEAKPGKRSSRATGQPGRRT